MFVILLTLLCVRLSFAQDTNTYDIIFIDEGRNYGPSMTSSSISHYSSGVSSLSTCGYSGNLIATGKKDDKTWRAEQAMFAIGDDMTSTQCKYLDSPTVTFGDIQGCIDACSQYNLENYANNIYCNAFSSVPCNSFDYGGGLTMTAKDCSNGGARGKTHSFICVLMQCPTNGGALGVPIVENLPVLTARFDNGLGGGAFVVDNFKIWFTHHSMGSDFVTKCVPPTPPPTKSPTKQPTKNPTKTPTKQPTPPTNNPTTSPTKSPTKHPTKQPLKIPTSSPTPKPTLFPTKSPTKRPTQFPTKSPTSQIVGLIDTLFISQLGITCTASNANKLTHSVSDYIGCYQKCALDHTGCFAFHVLGTICTTFAECTNPAGTPAIGELYILKTKNIITGQPTGSPTIRPTDNPTPQPTAPTRTPTTKAPTLVPVSPPTPAGLVIIISKETQTYVMAGSFAVAGVVLLALMRMIYTRLFRGVSGSISSITPANTLPDFSDTGGF